MQRLLAKRPSVPPTLALPPGERIVLADGTSSTPAASASSSPQGLAPPDLENTVALEIATLEVRQSRSFDRDLSFADLDADGINEKTSPYSNITLISRFNPSPLTSVDLRSSYHILYKDVADVSLSGSIRKRLAQFRFSVVHRNGLGFRRVNQLGQKPTTIFVRQDDDTQIRLTTGLSLFRNKLQLDLDTSYDANPPVGQPKLSDKRWRIQYQTQCCTFLVEQLTRNFSDLADRNDIYFRVDLKGVGKILDFNY